MFRNLRFYRVHSAWPESESAVAARLQSREFKPCGPYSERSAGWERLHDYGYCRRINGADFMQLRVQSRVLPAAALNEAVEARAAEYTARMQEPPSPRERRRLRAELRDELLPQALLKSERIGGCFLLAESTLGIDAGSDVKAERFLDQLRPCMPAFEFAPLAYNDPLGPLLNALLMGEVVPDLGLGRECRLQDPSDKQAVALWRNVDLQAADVHQQLQNGMQLTHLAVEFDALFSGVLATDGRLSKLRWAESAIDDRPPPASAAAPDPKDELAQADADAVLLSGAARQFLRTLERQLDGFASERTVAAEVSAA